jgi:SRSO17 transposase
VQHLRGRAAWSADEVRDALRAYVMEQCGDPQAVLVVDETGYLKKGQKSVGVARQSTVMQLKILGCGSRITDVPDL